MSLTHCGLEGLRMSTHPFSYCWREFCTACRRSVSTPSQLRMDCIYLVLLPWSVLERHPRHPFNQHGSTVDGPANFSAPVGRSTVLVDGLSRYNSIVYSVSVSNWRRISSPSTVVKNPLTNLTILQGKFHIQLGHNIILNTSIEYSPEAGRKLP